MGSEIYLLDLLGTFTFALYGAHVGLKRHFDIFGVFVTAFLTAVGGSTLREMLLGSLPAYFYDMQYVFAIFLGLIVAVLFFKKFSDIKNYALVVDAIGLVTFSLIGAERAQGVGLGAFGIIFLATLSAVGGGLVRDIAIAETPQIFYQDFYASPAIFLGVLYVLFGDTAQSPFALFIMLASAYLLRLFAIYLKWDLWGPWREKRV